MEKASTKHLGLSKRTLTLHYSWGLWWVATTREKRQPGWKLLAQAVQGASRPTRHKTLVKNARQILWALQQKTAVQWEWVNGHSGQEFNELADQLAEQGKTKGCWQGGRQSLPRVATVATISSPVLSSAGSVSEKYAHFVNAIQRAQEATLPVLLAQPRKPWITPRIATEIERVRQLRIRCSDDYKQAYKDLKKQARKQKRDWTRKTQTQIMPKYGR